MTEKTPFGTALRHYRKKRRGLNQKRLALAVGCKQSMISDIENGKKAGSAELREAISTYLKVSYSDMITKGNELLHGFSKKDIANLSQPNQPPRNKKLEHKLIKALDTIIELQRENAELRKQLAEQQRAQESEPQTRALI